MLTPDFLDEVSAPALKLWEQVEDDILTDMARRLAKMGDVTDTAVYQLQRLEQVRLFRSDVTKRLAEASGQSAEVIARLMAEAGTASLLADDGIHALAGKTVSSLNDSPALRNLLTAGAEQTAGTLENLTATTANTASRQLERALDRAWLQTASGAFDYETACRRCIASLAEEGLEAVRYPSGHVDTLETAVRRAVVTGVNSSSCKLNIERCKEMGCDLVEVTAHAGARPSHAAWQGKVYSISGESDIYPPLSVTGYGTGAGLAGWNCRHNAFAYYDGISEPTYTEERLAELDAKNITWNGRQYTRYEISQMQRARERRVRKWKRQYAMEEAAGLDTTKTSLRLKTARNDLSGFVSATNGQKSSLRTYTSGFGRSQASKAGWTARKAAAAAKNAVANAAESGIMTLEEGENVVIHSIDLPIEQRNSAKGKPGAILHYDVPLSVRQQRLLDALPEYNSRASVAKSDVNMVDLSALTAKTGDEFALFTKQGERLVVRGNTVSVDITPEEARKMSAEGYVWSGHTHPGNGWNVLQPSEGDYMILNQFHQQQSAIYNSSGEYLVFERSEPYV